MNTATPTVRAEKKSVNRSCRWMHADPVAEFAAGRGVCLALWFGDRLCDVYEVWPLVEGDRVAAWLVRKCDDASDVHEYRVSGDCRECNCPHSRHRPHAAPCRHRSSLRAALARLGFEF